MLLLAWLHPTAIAKRLVHKGFEDDTDKEKLTAEQVASLVSDPCQDSRESGTRRRSSRASS